MNVIRTIPGKSKLKSWWLLISGTYFLPFYTPYFSSLYCSNQLHKPTQFSWSPLLCSSVSSGSNSFSCIPKESPPAWVWHFELNVSNSIPWPWSGSWDQWRALCRWTALRCCSVCIFWTSFCLFFQHGTPAICPYSGLSWEWRCCGEGQQTDFFFIWCCYWISSRKRGSALRSIFASWRGGHCSTCIWGFCCTYFWRRRFCRPSRRWGRWARWVPPSGRRSA